MSDHIVDSSSHNSFTVETKVKIESVIGTEVLIVSYIAWIDSALYGHVFIPHRPMQC